MITIFTDGSCSFNSKNAKNKGGYSFVAINEHGEKIYEFVGSDVNTTSNRMELKAILAALKFIGSHKGQITIFSDSQYVINSINQKWIYNWQKKDFKRGHYKKPIPNDDLWKEVYEHITQKPNITFKWCRGHSNNKWNEYCDQLAKSVWYKNFIVNS